MQLARPEWLWCFAVLPVLTLVTGWAWVRRRRDWSALGQGGRPASDGSACWLLAAIALGVALTQPRWGRSEGPPTPPGHDVVIAVDVSRSMAARDTVPDRLGVAIESAEGLIGALGREPGDRVAVVAFAGRGVLRCPLTRNLGAAVETLRSLQGGTVPAGGTDLGAGLDAARDAFDDQDRAGGRSVVILSDGEDHAGHWQAAAEKLRAQGVIVHAVALGDLDAGHVVPTRAGPLRYRGEVVLSRRSDEALTAIARATGGAFVPLGLATTDMARLYQTRIEPGARAVRGATRPPERRERFPLFLLAALGFALIASLPSRRRPWRAVWGLVAALGLALPGASPRDDPAGAVAEGRAAYAAGRYAEALSLFQEARKLAPKNPIPTYDAAAALFQLGHYQEAETLYLDARPRADVRLRTRIDYALGNTSAARGDASAAIRHYDDCLASTARGPDLDRVREDAAINRRFIKEQTLPPPPEPGEGTSPRSDPAQGTSQQKKNGRAPGAANQEPGNTGNGASPGKRGAGGAGGSGPVSPQAGSAEDQLAQALNHVRDARRGRIDDSPATDDREEGKDW